MVFNALRAVFPSLWGAVALSILSSVVGICGALYLANLHYGIVIAGLKLSYERQRADSVSASLTKLNKFIAQIDNAGKNYSANVSDINTRFDKLESDFKHEKIIPLPSDCKPNANRLQSLRDTITTTNSSITGTAH